MAQKSSNNTGGEVQKPRKSGGVRSCYNKNGSPKRAFATKKLAERAIPRTSVNLGVYACAEHGWHLGHRSQ
jgi:hypothetical protein